MTRTVLVVLLVAMPCFAANESKPSEEQILSWLRELKPLPKVHYSWPLPVEKLSGELLHEYARLTHAVSLSGEWGKPEQVDRAVTVCKRVNADKPKISASIGINYSVWHRRFGKDLPPTDTGPTHQAELDYLKTRMEAMRGALAEANRRQDANVAITAVLFDSEHFHIHADDSQWNQAITSKYNAAYDLVRTIFRKYASNGTPAARSNRAHRRPDGVNQPTSHSTRNWCSSLLNDPFNSCWA
jgi:hypothetical protein